MLHSARTSAMREQPTLKHEGRPLATVFGRARVTRYSVLSGPSCHNMFRSRAKNISVADNNWHGRTNGAAESITAPKQSLLFGNQRVALTTCRALRNSSLGLMKPRFSTTSDFSVRAGGHSIICLPCFQNSFSGSQNNGGIQILGEVLIADRAQKPADRHGPDGCVTKVRAGGIRATVNHCIGDLDPRRKAVDQ